MCGKSEKDVLKVFSLVTYFMVEEKNKTKQSTKNLEEGALPSSVSHDVLPSSDLESDKTSLVKKKKKWKNQIVRGRANIRCSYNNTIVTLTDMNGATLAWSSSGHMGFKGAKKSTPYAATQVVGEVVEKTRKFGLQEVEVLVRGVGSGREAAVRALANNGLSLLSIRDITPLPHGGCRPRKPRRV